MTKPIPEGYQTLTPMLILKDAGKAIDFYVYVKNVDDAFKVAVNAGTEVRMHIKDMFWGDRMGTAEDPFGYSWNLASRTRDLTPEEVEEGAKIALAKMSEK